MDKIKIGLGEYNLVEWFAEQIIYSHTDYDTDPDGLYLCVFCECPIKEPNGENEYHHSDTCPVTIARKFIKDRDANK